MILSDTYSFCLHRKDHSILLVCGAGTCLQNNRFYGVEVSEIYRRLKTVLVSLICIYIDTLGCPNCFIGDKNAYRSIDREKLRIFCPFDGLRSWLLFFVYHIDSIKTDIKFIDKDICVSAIL